MSQNSFQNLLKQNSRAIFWTIVLIWASLTVARWHAQRSTDIKGFLLIVVFLTALCFEIVAFLHSIRAIDQTKRQNIKVLISAVAISVFFAEFILRTFVEGLQGHNEENGQPYISAFNITVIPCDSCGGRKMYVNRSNGEVGIGNNEFHYVHRYNGFGLRDKQFDKEKSEKEFRILGIGDSFAEGVGTSADSTWLKQLEYKLNLGQDTVVYTTMNAGAHGSDLFFSYELLSKCLLSYHPDLVVLDLNATDIADVTRGGGDERFDSNGEFQPRRGPWWEFAFGSSHIVRLFVLKFLDYDWQFRSPQARAKEDQIAVKLIGAKVKEYQALAEREHFKFLLVLQPLHQDFSRGDQFCMLQVDSSICKIDLYPYFKNKIINQRYPVDRYYWPIDGHFKGSGYGEMAERIKVEYFENHTESRD